ncbi:C-type lectin domain family 10 member A-like [Channa argus]|uniref:C-type lectin domain family 10 member A-like n=1 Tax=Channa argus TaxID=215402 RepID=UPI00351FDF95
MSYNNVTKENNQLQISYNNMMEEQNQIRKRFEDMTNKLNDLQRDLSKVCCDGWVKFGTACYCISTVQKTRQESRQEYLNKGADLVIINSIEEQVSRNEKLQIKLRLAVNLQVLLIRGLCDY